MLGGLLFDLACSAAGVAADRQGRKVKMKPVSQAPEMLPATSLPLCWVLSPTSAAGSETVTAAQR